MRRVQEWIKGYNLNGLINMNQPHLWFPEARKLSPRKIICHIGPTNSG